METSGRSILERELAELNTNILRMTSLVDQAILGAMEALDQRDLEKAHTVISDDGQVNQLRYEIEQACLMILATQQPFAVDLRTVLTSLHLTLELERIGDHAADIARLVDRLRNEPEIDSLHKLPKMAKQARRMLKESIQAYVDRDVTIAREMIRRDEKVDKHYRRVFQESLEEMRDDEYIRRATFLLLVGHNLERMGDRAINIAERVIFMVSGQFVDLHDLVDKEPIANSEE